MGHSMGGRNSYIWASRHPGTLASLVIVDTGPDIIRTGGERIRQFLQLPDELDSIEEFVQRVQAYTGRSRNQTLGSLKHSIRQQPNGKWTWKYDKAMRSSERRPSSWTPEKLWECLKLIDCPTVVVRGSDTDVFSEETMQRMQQAIPDCSTATVAKAGHLVQGDNPAGFVAAVRELLHRVH